MLRPMAVVGAERASSASRAGAGHRALLVLFFLTGISGLVYQVVWLRMLIRAFGVTIYAVTTLVALFMAGLALGSFLGARISRGRSKLIVYAAMELAVGACALGSTWIMRELPTTFRWAITALGDGEGALMASRFMLSALVLIPPTTLMGTTLPLLSGLLAGRGDAGATGRLYAANTFGAVSGVLATGFAMIPMLGEVATVAGAAFLNVAVGAACLLGRERLTATLTRDPASVTSGEPAQPEPTPAEPAGVVPRASPRLTLGVAFASGASALALEVLWSRVLTVMLGNSVYAFSALLGAYLVGIAVGSAFVASRLSRVQRPLALLGLLEVAVGVLGAASLATFLGIGLIERVWWKPSYAVIWGLDDFAWLGMEAIAIVLPVTLVLGAIFPLLCHLASPPGAPVGAGVGRVYGVNTLGGIFGSLLAGFVLIPALGTAKSVMLVSLSFFAVGVLVLLRARALEGSRAPLRALAPALALLGLFAFVTREDPFLQVLQGYVNRAGSNRLVFHEEDRGATVSIFESPRGSRSMFINGLYTSNTSTGIGEQMLNVPLAFHPEDGPKRVLTIGLGVGEALRYGIDVGHSVTVVELQPTVVRAFRALNPDASAYLESPRARLVMEDGRNFLLRDDSKYDLIVVDVSPPLYASGMANLYSREFAQLARSHLTESGLFVIWFPVICFEEDFFTVYSSMVETFGATAVYSPPISSNAMILGSNASAPLWPAQRELFRDRYRRFSAIVDPDAHVVAFEVDQAELIERAKRYPPLTDDRPTTEFPLQGFLRGDTYYRENRFLWNPAAKRE